MMIARRRGESTTPTPDRGLMNYAHRLPIAIAVIAMTSACYRFDTAAADDKTGASMFSFHAFGTLGAVHSSEDNADFTSSTFKPDGAGYTRPWSANVDSRVGGQVTADFTPRLSAVLQLIAEQNYANSYRPEVEWANIKYQFTPDFGVRVGRIELPLFLVSDARKVGYVNPWVRPPGEVYNVVPITNSDGIDASYRMHMGDVTSTLGAAYGRVYHVNFPAGSSIDVRDLRGLFSRTEYGAALFNLSYVAAHITLSPGIPLLDDFREFGPAGEAIADRYQVIGKLATVVSAGASYDPGKWLATAEWTEFDGRSFLGVDTGWYVSGGYRVSQFTPYLTYSALTVSSKSAAGLDTAALPPNQAGFALALNGGLNELLATRPVQRTISAGSRWDFAKNFDFKLQFDHTRLGHNSSGTLINLQPGFKTGGTLNLCSVAIDFVF
jgi:hypothetical protein